MRDRALQTAVLLLLSEEVERRFEPCCFSYRLGVDFSRAIEAISEFRDEGRQWAIRMKIESLCESIPRDSLFGALEESGVPRALIPLFKTWLATPVVEPNGEIVRAERGFPQGLPISSLLANLYLTFLDRAAVAEELKYVRYDDEMVVCCREREDLEEAESFLKNRLAALGLSFDESRTRKSSFETGFDFLNATFKGRAAIARSEPDCSGRDFKPPRSRSRLASLATPTVLTKTLYLQRQGSTLARKGRAFVVRYGTETLLELPLIDVDQIYVFGNVQLTTQATALCLENDSPVNLFSQRGKYYGVIRAPLRSAWAIKSAQVRFREDPEIRLAFAKKIVAAKIRNARALILRFGRNHPSDADEVAEPLRRMKTDLAVLNKATSLTQLLGVEGMAAKSYFEAFARCVRNPAFAFGGRSRRPPVDPINSMLSFAYSLVLYRIDANMAARGIDSTIGLMHESRGYSALAYDLLEEFRQPLADALVLKCVNDKLVAPTDFYYAEGDPQPCFLKDESRGKFLRAFETKLDDERSHPDSSVPADWRRVIDLQVCRLRRFFEGEIDVYEPLEVR